MKYVMFKKKLNTMTIYYPVIFPNHLVHADIASNLTNPINGQLAGFTIDSAGDVSLFGGDIRCSGASTTLNIKSKPKRDSKIIHMNDYGGGMY